MREFRNPADIHEPAASYSHQVELRDVRMLVLSGQIGMLPDGSLPSDPYEQLAIALDNVAKNLVAADMSVDDLVKLKIYLVGDWDSAKRRQAVAAFLGTHRPTMTVIGASALGASEMVVEVEATAAR